MSKKLSQKKSLLLTRRILGLLVNTLAADDKCPVLNRDNLTIPILMQISQKEKFYFQLFGWFSKSKLNFEAFEKIDDPHRFWFVKLRTPKPWLDKCLKSPASEDPSTSNLGNVRKNCWNLHHNTFIISIGQCQGNWVGKSVSYWHAKSWDCLLTHWLPMTSILCLIDTI